MYTGYRSFVEIGANGLQVIRSKTDYARCYLENPDPLSPWTKAKSLVTEIRAGSVGLQISSKGIMKLVNGE